MTPEQVLAEFDPARIEPDPGAVPDQEREAEPAADREADIVADYRAGRRRRDHRYDVELVRRPGEDRGRDQHGLARERDADALEADDDHHRDVAVLRDELLRVDERRMENVATPS